MIKSIDLNAHGKINLGLDVVRKRPDGYHEVRMIMQTIGLHDKISISKINSPDIKVETNLPFLPTDDKNIVYKAVALMKETFQINDGFYINLDKRIPISAGLAGGSTDAAAAIIGVNHLYGLNLSLEELMDIGVNIGADVPFCLMGGTALSEGIGEKLTPLPAFPNCHILLVKPNINISTKYTYENLDLNKIDKHPDIDSIVQGISNHSISEATKHSANVLESVTETRHPEITTIKNAMVDQGAIVSMMSGSGPTVFGIFDNAQKANNALYHFKVSNFKYQVFLTKPVSQVFNFKEDT